MAVTKDGIVYFHHPVRGFKRFDYEFIPAWRTTGTQFSIWTEDECCFHQWLIEKEKQSMRRGKYRPLTKFNVPL